VTEATRALVIEKIRQVFPEREVADVLALLDRYGAADHHRDKERVQLAILKLCDEEGRDDPTAYVETACADYRDVLAWAESPNLFGRIDCTDPDERARLIAQDRAQYVAWLEGR
jgi:hypothetical protein